ncbi:MAG: hypothetical protein KOO60_11135 [Gemmatimonadales bacterium]|nr:hypothetical protein [Gemmatimonadales bacterium]
MLHRVVYITFLVVLVFPALSWATPGVPDPEQSNVETGLVEDVSLVVSPNGSGTPLTEAKNFQGQILDATVIITFRDSEGFPVLNMPAEDIWMESECGSLCFGNISSEQGTDINGQLFFQNPLFAGGCCEEYSLWISYNGVHIGEGTIPFIRYNSPDMNGDLEVNLTDVSSFASHFYSSYSYCADFKWDGVLNLLDVGILAGHIGSSCP